MDISDEKLAKIRALLTKAEASGVTPEEAEAYSAKAFELAAKYGVEDAQLYAAGETKDEIDKLVIWVEPPYPVPKTTLLHAVAKALGCDTIRMTSDARQGAHVHVYGFKSDLARVEMLYTSLLVQAWHGMSTAPVPYDEHARTFRVNWWSGFTSVVRRRLEAAFVKATAEADAAEPGTAIAVRDRGKAVEEAICIAHPDAVTASRSFYGSAAGQEAGAQAGRNADIGVGKVGRGAREISR